MTRSRRATSARRIASVGGVEEASALDGTMPLLTPYRVKDVSYWFGVPVTLVRWLKPVGSAVAEGEPLALISVQATDLNTVSDQVSPLRFLFLFLVLG